MVSFLLDYYQKHNPMHYRFLKEQADALYGDDALLAHMKSYLACLEKNGVTQKDLLKGYNLLLTMQLRESIYFKRHGRYRYSTLQETEAHVYSDAEYMRRYMLGLGISNMMWPAHRSLFHFFSQQLTGRSAGGRYLEIGIGHGLQFVQALKSQKFNFCYGVDISTACIELTRALVSQAGQEDNCQLVCADFFGYQPDTLYNFVVFGELLEHIENPEDFLRKVHEILTDDGEAYLSTCANSPAIDHIYLFRSADEIRALLHNCGFAIVREFVLGEASPMEGEPEEISYAAVVRKQGRQGKRL